MTYKHHPMKDQIMVQQLEDVVVVQVLQENQYQHHLSYKLWKWDFHENPLKWSLRRLVILHLINLVNDLLTAFSQ